MTIQQTRASRAPRDARSGAIVTALVDRGILARDRSDDAVTVVDEVLGTQATGPAPLRRRFAELAGYVGGAFVVSAGGIFFATQWPELSGGAQVALLVGLSMVLAVAAVAVAGIGDGFAAIRSGAEPVQRRLAGVLMIGAGVSAAAAVGIQVDRMIEDFTTAPPILAFTTFTLVAVAGYLLAPTVVGQLAIAVGLFAMVPSGLDYAFGEVSAVAVGLIVLGIGVAWLALTERGLWWSTASARAFGCALVLLGAQFPAFDWDDQWVGYLLLAGVAAAAFLAYVARTAWPYLATGVAALTLVVPQALLEWTDNALGPAGALLATGVTLLGASLLGLRIRKEVSEADE